MNWLFVIESTCAGLFAGLGAYLFTDSDFTWNALENFRAVLLVSVTFCSLFSGLIFALPIFVFEKKIVKFVNRFFFAGSLSAVVVSIGVISYRLLNETYYRLDYIQGKADRLFWWLLLGICLTATIALLGASYKNWGRAIMGIIPPLLVSGVIIDKGIIGEINCFWNFMLLGITVGMGYGIVWDLLKESWLEESAKGSLSHRYYLDSESFWVGSSNYCDITLNSGPEICFKITEKDDYHILETNDNTDVTLNNNRVRYRVLADGDIVTVGDRIFVYHTKVARARDVVPEPA